MLRFQTSYNNCIKEAGTPQQLTDTNYSQWALYKIIHVKQGSQQHPRQSPPVSPDYKPKYFLLTKEMSRERFLAFIHDILRQIFGYDKVYKTTLQKWLEMPFQMVKISKFSRGDTLEIHLARYLQHQIATYFF